MSDYAIGDVQGCFDALQRLLECIDFNEHRDTLWFVGDLVNRGPQSLLVLRFIKNLPLKPRVSLGNHDFHLLSNLFLPNAVCDKQDTFNDILMAHDRDELGEWLRMQKLLHHDMALKVVMSHAGIAPIWSLSDAKGYARELEENLASPDFRDFLMEMYGNKPNRWSPALPKIQRLRLICNYFTRMRYCYRDGSLDFSFKGSHKNRPAKLYPWYDVPNRCDIEADIVFGHWAELGGKCMKPNIHAIDTGYVWGKTMTALRLQDKQRFSVCHEKKAYK